jgi:hypothetical protein
MRRIVYPLCELCVHYHKSATSKALSKCSKFTYLDSKWDNEEYEYADSARRILSKCGKEGKHYVRATRRDLTKDD